MFENFDRETKKLLEMQKEYNAEIQKLGESLITITEHEATSKKFLNEGGGLKKFLDSFERYAYQREQDYSRANQYDKNLT